MLMLWSGGDAPVTDIPIIGDILGVVYDGFGEVIELLDNVINFIDRLAVWTNVLQDDYIIPLQYWVYKFNDFLPDFLKPIPLIVIGYAIYCFIVHFGAHDN